MRYLVIVLSVAAVALVAVGTSTAARAEHVNIQIDEHFQSGFRAMRAASTSSSISSRT